jgi:hypothetical protein
MDWLGVAVLEAVVDRLAVADGLAVPTSDDVWEELGVAAWLPVAVTEGVTVGLPLGPCDPLRLGVELCVTLGVPLDVDDTEAVPVADAL